MCNVHYTEPTSVASALQVIGDITLVASSQQFGGFTIPEIDKTLLPYIKKSLEKYKKEAEDYNIEFKDSYIDKHVKRELEQGFQGLELKLNTVVSARGDFPFTTLTFGQWNTNLEPVDKYWLSEVCLAILNTRIKGHAGKQVVFPKLVYLYDENQVNNDDYSKKVFNKALECSAKCMYPDWLSLSGSEKVNKVAQEFKNYGKIISPMGCRAYLSHWIDPETNESITIGRCNIGAVSLNIPLIIAVAQKEFSSNWKDKFWDLLEDRLEVVRNFLRKRYDMIKHTKASTNPMAFTQGGFYEGYLKPDEEIGDLVKYMTASFGITALNEASILWFNKSIAEDNSFAISVMEFITDKVESFKRQDGYLYALYGTPAESLMGTQAKQYRDYTNDTRFGEYFSNSFHCHVSEDITPIEKQDKEFKLFHMINGGHIQYVRLDNPENLEAVKSVILRGMKLGFYQGVNFDAGYCEDCGSHFTNCMNTCPNCGSTHITIISRVCGYLGYSKVDGNTRFNDALLQNVHDRKSM